MEEIRKHATEESAWLAVDGKVYDVTKFIKAHPGGRLPIMEVAGLDATDPVTNYHSPEVSGGA
jgi:cytochrome b involved in lipid metabolism